MNRAKLEAIATQWMEAGWQRGDADAVDEMHDATFVDHDTAGRDLDRAAFKQGIEGLYRVFPDFFAEISTMIIDETNGSVAIRWTAKGTHKGEFMGFDPTDKEVHFRGIEIIRIEKERIVERWGEWDGLDILEQLKSTE